MEEFDIRDFCKEYKHYSWLVVVLIIIGWLIATFYTCFIQVPMYESHISLALAKSNTAGTALTQNDVSINNQLVKTYQEIIKSKLILSQVIKDLGIDYNINDLKENISVASVENTEVINVSVKDQNPATASDIANKIGEVFSREASTMYLDNIKIVDEADEAAKPYNVHVEKQLLFGAGLGFILSSIIILIIFMFDDKIKNKEQIEEKVYLSVLGTIPMKKRKNKKTRDSSDLIVMKNPKSIISESFRSIRTNLDYITVDDDTKSFLITSSIPGEGKSFFAANLAIAFAQNDKKVLLVDCDLRRGRQNRIFNAKSNTKGFTDLISDRYALNNWYTYLVKSDIPSLDLLFKGRAVANPTEVLGSDRCQSLIELFEDYYDVVIFDSAPLNERLSDSKVMSRTVKKVVVVSENNKTSVSMLKETKSQLEMVDAKILGVVLNKVTDNRKEYNSYYG